MKRLTICLAFALLGVACGGETSRPGSPDVYASIAALTDCTELQGAFDRAEANFNREPKGTKRSQVPFSYMEAALKRMQQLKC